MNQLNLIINTLQNCSVFQPKNYYEIDKALAAALELREKLAKPEQENEAYSYAKRLAEFIWKEHYKEESPDWTPLSDVLGVLTQIDNMTCGLEKAKPEQEPYFCKDCGKGLLGKEHIHTCSPQVKRQWVGLTDDEVVACWARPDMFAIAHAIENAFRRKNT